VAADRQRPDDLTAEASLVRSGLRTPKAAAIAGIVFSILLICCLWLLRLVPPTGSAELAAWLQASSQKAVLALDLVPFAGIAFMWFLGVLCDRLGAMEDKFFATVFLGSGLMFLGMLFVAASAGADLSARTPMRRTCLPAMPRSALRVHSVATSCTFTPSKWRRCSW
jgi:hypothetical protein